MISYAGSLDLLRGPLSWHYRNGIQNFTGHDMIIHDRGSPAPLHSKHRFVNLPELISKG